MVSRTLKLLPRRHIPKTLALLPSLAKLLKLMEDPTVRKSSRLNWDP
jgi:hypothetical protein